MKGETKLNYSDFNDFAYKVKNKLCEDINGKVTYVIYSSQDGIVFNIEFKDFKFSTLVTEVQDKIYQGLSVDSICEDIENEYKAEVLKSIFKSDHRKKMDSERKLISVDLY